jgi:uncharacterized membrane protein YfcA
VWLLVALVAAGAFAQLIDGSLGMGFGVTSSSFLLALGLTPAFASASVHTAEVFTTLASGTAHWRLGNVDRRTLVWLAVPGCIGGALGAVALSGFDPTGSKPLVAAFLLVMGALIVVRTVRGRRAAARPLSRTRTGALGFVAASLDAFGGGGWGPIATPTLILSASHEPRKAVGTVSLAEFFVTCSITATFLFMIGVQGIRWDFVAAVAVGGVAMAPVAAHLSKRVPPKVLGGAVGTLLVALNARALAVSLGGADAALSAIVTLAGLAAILAWMLLRALRPHGKSPAQAAPDPTA